MTRIEKLLTQIKDTLSAARPAKEIMDLKETAAYMGVSRTKLYDLISVYEGPAFAPITSGEKRGGIRFRKVDVDEWLKARLVRCAEDERRLLDARRAA